MVSVCKTSSGTFILNLHILQVDDNPTPNTGSNGTSNHTDVDPAFFDLVVVDAMIDLIVASFGLFAFLCVLIGTQDRSEKLLQPALIFIPIDFLKCTFFATIFAATLGSYNPVAIKLVVLNALQAFIYVPKWIAIYSLRQELLGNDGNGNYEVAQNQVDKFKSFVEKFKRNKHYATLLLLLIIMLIFAYLGDQEGDGLPLRRVPRFSN